MIASHRDRFEPSCRSVTVPSQRAARVARNSIVYARGELQASEELREAAETLSKSPASLQLRYLQTLLELGADHNSTVVFPLPVDIIAPFLRHPEMLQGIADSFNHRG